MKHHFFLCTLFILCCIGSANLFSAEWYRGNTHMHSFWSDGDVFPEQAIQWYKDREYQFVCLSDHNLIQNDPNRWITADEKKQYVQKTFDEYVAQFGRNWVETKDIDGKQRFRLKTWKEFKDKMDAPGKFLVIPGQEINGGSKGRQVHGNTINTTETITFDPSESPSHSFRIAAEKTALQGKETGRSVLYVQNHHNWPYFDIDPALLIERNEIRFFEFCNANSGPKWQAHEKFWNIETFWDIVLAFRIANGSQILYGLASDDTHLYHPIEKHKAGQDRPGLGWIVVRADKLEPESIVDAMNRGEFYASTGVALNDVSFDKATHTLSVQVKPEKGVRYTILFRTTKRGFDTTTTTIEDPAAGQKPARTVTVYSDEIGRIAKKAEGIDGSYTMQPDDLYVRAVIISDKSIEYPGDNAPKHGTAWTQPFLP